MELELKVLNIDKSKIINTLLKLGAKKTLDAELKSYFFSNNNIKLRLRCINNEFFITYKDVKPYNSVIIAHEIEFKFDSYNKMAELLKVLGFELYATSTKHRESYSYEEIKFEIDTLPSIPTFLEIESNSESNVLKGLNILGYTIEDSVNFTESQIKKHYGVI